MTFSSYTFTNIINPSTGLPYTISTNPEVTDSTLFDNYISDISTIRGALLSASQAQPPGLTSAQVDVMKQALSRLWNVALHGSGGNFYTTAMADNVNMMFLSLDMVGIDPTNVNATSTSAPNWNTWMDLAVASPVLKNTFDFITEGSNSSLQALIELHYVKTGNDMLSTQLTNMQQALSSTQKVLSTLTALQNLHNSIEINNKSTLPFDLTRTDLDSGGYVTAYRNATSTFFNSPITPDVALPAGAQFTVGSSSFFNQQFATLLLQSTWAVSPPNDTVSSDFGAVGPIFIPSSNTEIPGIFLDSGSDHIFVLVPDNPVFTSVPSYMSDLGFADASLNAGDYAIFQNHLNSIGGVVPPGYKVFDATSNSGPHPTPIAQKETAFRTMANIYQAGYRMLAITPTVTVLAVPPGGEVFKSDIQNVLGYDITGSQNLTNTVNNLVTQRMQLSSLIAALSTQLAASTLADPNSIYSLSKRVLKDLNTVFVSGGNPITSGMSLIDSFSGFKNWVLDNYQNANVTGGGYQQNITFAITSAQNLNTQQQQNVQSYLFLFEQYYKSASAILQQITQILTRIAQHISQ